MSGLKVVFPSTRAGKKCAIGSGGPPVKGDSFPVAYAEGAGPAGNNIVPGRVVIQAVLALGWQSSRQTRTEQGVLS